MVELKTCEHLIHFMKSGKLRLSRYDNRFISNIETIVHQKNVVTSNQVSLLHKIVNKYSRQLGKFGYSAEQLCSLPWKAKVIDSHTAFTDAYINITNNKIIFKSPFNKNFLTEFRKHNPNSFVWDKENRCHTAEFGTYNLKLLTTIAFDFFDTVHCCDITQKLLTTLTDTETDIYDPTLVRVNNNFYIAALNQYLNEALPDIKLNDDLRTLAKLSTYGITISDDIIQGNIAKVIASQYETVIDMNDHINIVNIAEKIGVDVVFISGAATIGPTMYVNELKKNLEHVGIHCYTGFERQFNKDFKNYMFPISIRFRSTGSIYEPKHVKKIIRIVNSQPVNIK